MKRLFFAFLALSAVTIAPATSAQAPAVEDASAAARDVVERLNALLLEVMRSADSLGFEGRRSRFSAALPEIYDFRRMAGVAVGRGAWRGLSDGDRQTYVTAFAELSAATYAARFKGWNDNAFVVDRVEEGPRGVLVTTRLTRPDDDDVRLDYLVRVDLKSERPAARVVDVIYDGGVSELAQRRSEYAATFRARGFDGLLASIEAATVAQTPAE